MYNVFQQKILDENKRCCRLYPESGDLDTLLLIFFQARELLREQNPDIFEQVDCKMHPEEVKEKMKKSEKLIPDAHVQGEPVKIFLAGLCEELVKNNKDFEKPLEHLQTSIRDFLDENNDIFPQSQLPVLVEKVVEETLLDRDFVAFLLTFIFSSLYYVPREGFLEELDTHFWEESFCPVCGENPHYGFLREEDGAKFLECWLCGTSWRYPRVKCPYCETEDQEKLGFFTVGENEICRVYFCRECQKYYKIFNWKKYAEEGASAAMHHLHTLHFDKLALKEGFSSSSGLKWVAKEDDGLVN
ncbi:MAG: formate dehydrogenase accessory protein FdhE [Candidatus Alkaliphilus sp. MAG34]